MRTDITQVSQRKRAEQAKRNDLEITLMIAAMALGAGLLVLFGR